MNNRRLLLTTAALATCAALLAPASAGDVGANYIQGPGGYYSPTNHSGPYAIGPDGTMYLLGSGLASAGITPAITQAGTSVVGKASQGNLYSAVAVNATATGGYLVCLYATTAPASGNPLTGANAPVDVTAMPGQAGAAAQINYGAGPPNAYSTGISCVITTTLATYTPGGNAFMQVRAR